MLYQRVISVFSFLFFISALSIGQNELIPPEVEKLRHSWTHLRNVEASVLYTHRFKDFSGGEVVSNYNGTVFFGENGQFLLRLPDTEVFSDGQFVVSCSHLNKTIVFDSLGGSFFDLSGDVGRLLNLIKVASIRDGIDQSKRVLSIEIRGSDGRFEVHYDRNSYVVHKVIINAGREHLEIEYGPFVPKSDFSDKWAIEAYWDLKMGRPTPLFSSYRALDMSK